MRKHMQSKGFTLIEVIVSIAIIGIVSVMFTGVFAKSLELSRANLKMNKQSIKAGMYSEDTDYSPVASEVPKLSFGGNTFDKSAILYKNNHGIFYRFRLSNQ